MVSLIETSNFLSNESLWFTIVDKTNRSDARWTNPYAWRGNIWISFSAVLWDKNDKFVGVGSADIDVAYMTSAFQKSKSDLTSATYVLNTQTKEIICMSRNDTPSTKSSGSLFTFEEYFAYEDLFVQLNSLMKQKNLANFYQLSKSSEYKLTSASRGMEFYFKVGSYKSAYGMDWTILHFMYNTEFQSNIQSRNKTTGGLILVVAILACLSSVLFGTWLRQNFSAFDDSLKKLSEFSTHYKTLPKKSRIRELNDMQGTLERVSQNVKDAIDAKPLRPFPH
jgi:methyl-accepting chemotaxis protein